MHANRIIENAVKTNPDTHGRFSLARILPETDAIPPDFEGAIAIGVFEQLGRLQSLVKHFVLCRRLGDMPARDVIKGTEVLRFGITNAEKTLLFSRISPLKNLFAWDSFNFHYFHQRRLARAIKVVSPDVIVIHNRPQFVPIMKKACPAARIVLCMHNEHLTNLPERIADTSGVLADGIIVVSKALYDITVNKYPNIERKMFLLENGVNPNRFKPPENDAEKESYRKKYGLAPKDEVILFIGRLVREKGPHILLEAMPRILEKRPEAKLIIAGAPRDDNDKYYKSLKKTAAGLKGSATITGFVPPAEVHELFAASDLMACPTNRYNNFAEGMPQVDLQAMATALPVVTSSSGGVIDLITDGVNGFLVQDELNSGIYADRITRLLNSPDLRCEMGRASRNIIIDKYSWDRTAENLHRYCHGLLGEERSRK